MHRNSYPRISLTFYSVLFQFDILTPPEIQVSVCLMLYNLLAEHHILHMSETTLYVRNINEKVSLNKVKPVLRRLFERYGEVIQLTAHQNLRMKGQAFVTYADPKSTEKAIKKLQGRPVFKKPIVIEYAKTNSDEYYLKNGDLAPVEERKKVKAERAEKEPESGKEKVPRAVKPAKSWQKLPPHHVLLLQSLPDSLLQVSSVEDIFRGFLGFEKARVIAFRKVAFLDFALIAEATACLETLDRELLNTATISFAKK